MRSVASSESSFPLWHGARRWLPQRTHCCLFYHFGTPLFGHGHEHHVGSLVSAGLFLKASFSLSQLSLYFSLSVWVGVLPSLSPSLPLLLLHLPPSLCLSLSRRPRCCSSETRASWRCRSGWTAPASASCARRSRARPGRRCRPRPGAWPTPPTPSWSRCWVRVANGQLKNE